MAREVGSGWMEMMGAMYKERDGCFVRDGEGVASKEDGVDGIEMVWNGAARNMDHRAEIL